MTLILLWNFSSQRNTCLQDKTNIGERTPGYNAMPNVTYLTIISVHCRKIWNLFVRTLEIGRKCSSLIFLHCFAVSVDPFYIFRQCNNIKRPQNNCSNCLKRAKTRVVLIVFDDVLCEVHTYTVAVSYHYSTWIRYQKKRHLGQWPCI